MNEKEIIEQLESLIEAWQLDEADLNQTDINAIKGMLDKNKKLKNQLEASEKARKEAMDYIKENPLYEEEYDYDYEENIYMSGIDDEYSRKILLGILEIDKGE